jgi:hypothetical protein
VRAVDDGQFVNWFLAVAENKRMFAGNTKTELERPLEETISR